MDRVHHGLKSMGLQRVGHDWSDRARMHTHSSTYTPLQSRCTAVSQTHNSFWRAFKKSTDTLLHIPPLQTEQGHSELEECLWYYTSCGQNTLTTKYSTLECAWSFLHFYSWLSQHGGALGHTGGACKNHPLDVKEGYKSLTNQYYKLAETLQDGEQVWFL